MNDHTTQRLMNTMSITPILRPGEHASRRASALRRSAVALIVSGFSLGLSGIAGAATTTTTTPRPNFSTASGTVAALTQATSSMEVQNPTSGQVTVSWTATTTFTQTVTVSASEVAVGSCVTVTSTSSKSKSGHLTASTVAVRQAGASGSCTGAGGGGFGFGAAPPGGASGFRPPSGTFAGGTFPGGRAFGSRAGAGASGFAAAAGRVASGQVTSVSGSTFVVKGVTPVLSKAKSKTADPKSTKGTKESSTTNTTFPKIKTKTTTTTVTYGKSTVFTTTQPASASNLSVGLCATALGPASQTGAITATTISLRTAPAGGCTIGGGFGGIGGFGGARGSGGGSAT